MLMDLLVVRAWRGGPMDLEKHARLACSMGRWRRWVAHWFARPAI
jgi:hypothetical protein